MKRTLAVGIGDIHGRFVRVNEWVASLENALGCAADVVLAVGDIEAFPTADEHLRKAVRRKTVAEFAEFVARKQRFVRPMYFIGGNNEDFAALHEMPSGGDIAAGVHYLGRAGATTLSGLRVAYLSGIHAPRFLEAPLEVPRTLESAKHAGYFRASEIAVAEQARDVDLMLVHEWPRGLVSRKQAEAHGERRELRAFKFPWIGNRITRDVVDAVKPKWLWCGHSHVPYATEVKYESGEVMRVACLDQAARPEGAVFWVEFEERTAVRAGWGIEGKVAWQRGQRWDETKVPEDGSKET